MTRLCHSDRGQTRAPYGTHNPLNRASSENDQSDAASIGLHRNLNASYSRYF